MTQRTSTFELFHRRPRGSVRMAAFGALLAACGASLPAQAQSVLTYKGPDREQKILAGARKEGQVVLYSAMIENQALRPLAQGFMKKYPFVKLTYWRADDGSLLAKIGAEVRSHHVVGDVLEGTGVAKPAIDENLLQPFYTPTMGSYPKRYRDPTNMWAPTRISYFGLAYNTKLVAPDKIPQSYEDLLKPWYKGKLAWRIGSASGTPLFITNLRVAWGESRALAYFKKLAKQKIVNFGSGSARTLVDRVIAGEYPIALNIFAHHPLISKAKGAPVNTKLLDPTASSAGTLGIIKGAPHPYAALLLADYILSPSGQRTLARANYFPADPNIPPRKMLAPVIPKNAGVRENFISPTQLNDMEARSQAIFKKFFR